jgi:hypothetical protein
MDAFEWAVIGGLLFLIVCVLVYAIIRLAREPHRLLVEVGPLQHIDPSNYANTIRPVWNA